MPAGRSILALAKGSCLVRFAWQGMIKGTIFGSRQRHFAYNLGILKEYEMRGSKRGTTNHSTLSRNVRDRVHSSNISTSFLIFMLFFFSLRHVSISFLNLICWKHCVPGEH